MTSRNPYERTSDMSNVSSKDGTSSGIQVPEPIAAVEDAVLITREQSIATLGTRMADPGILHHFQTALMSLVSEAQKIGLSLPVGLGIPSPYDLASTPGGPPLGRLRSEVHIATPDPQTDPSAEEMPQDQPEVLERKRVKEREGTTG